MKTEVWSLAPSCLELSLGHLSIGKCTSKRKLNYVQDKVSTVLTYLLHFMGTAPSGIWWQQLGTDIYQLWPVYFLCSGKASI